MLHIDHSWYIYCPTKPDYYDSVIIYWHSVCLTFMSLSLHSNAFKNIQLTFPWLMWSFIVSIIFDTISNYCVSGRADTWPPHCLTDCVGDCLISVWCDRAQSPLATRQSWWCSAHVTPTQVGGNMGGHARLEANQILPLSYFFEFSRKVHIL